jgi:hypothetical protein
MAANRAARTAKIPTREQRAGVPAAVLALFPTGVTLDPAQARRTLTS